MSDMAILQQPSCYETLVNGFWCGRSRIGTSHLFRGDELHVDEAVEISGRGIPPRTQPRVSLSQKSGAPECATECNGLLSLLLRY